MLENAVGRMEGYSCAEFGSIPRGRRHITCNIPIKDIPEFQEQPPYAGE